MQDHADTAHDRLRLLTTFRADRAAGRPIRRLAWAYFAVAVGLGLLLGAGAWLPGVALLAEARRGGVAGLALGSVLLALAGLVGTAAMAGARGRIDAAGRAARWPQALLVAPLAAAGIVGAWRLRPASLPLAGPASDAYLLAGVVILLAFPLLVAERLVAALPDERLPEASDLRALLFLPVLVWPAAGLLELAATLDLRLTMPLGAALALLLAAIGAELAGRAAARLFLPPPDPEAARAAVHASLARIVADGVRHRGGIAAPIRQHLGIDFSRSWALSYVRAALAPLVLALLVLAWGLSGVMLVGLDQRAVYERLGAPAGVLQPGLHVGLPWPLGRARPVEFGAVHEIALTAAGAGPAERSGAEDPAPASADRLWKQGHPAELAFLVAGESGGRQSFQTVSADLRVLYQVGLSDADALRATYGTVAPEALIRAAASRVAARFFAGETVETVLGADREAMAERLRVRLQADLAAFASGVDLVAVIVEAIHPPAGAADAYHGVQAAEIAARASISAERGRALALRAAAGQHATELVNQARIAAADILGGARIDLTRFTADREAAAAGGQAFLLERYFANISASLARAPLTIIDNRITAAGGAVLDLRPPAASGAPGAGPGME